MISAVPYDPKAYQLLHEGLQALARVEHTGFKIDETYLASAVKDTNRLIERKQAALMESKVMRVWQDRFRTKTNLGSNQQLGKILFENLGFKCPTMTASGQYGTDEDTLGTVDHPFVKDWLAIKKHQKGVQFLCGVRDQVIDGFLHAVFNLHIVTTYRSSSDSPNFQNIPVRDDWMRNLVRRAFVARKGRRIVEIDYGSVEVRGAYCYHKDPNMRKYLLDKTKDMHRDAAMDCFKLKLEQMTGKIRYSGKNQFVFPQFYGDWWMSCASALWIAAETLETAQGVPLRQHLAKKGITELGAQDRKSYKPEDGTFEAHIQKVEKIFWEDRFSVYAQWKKDWYAEYQANGWFKTLTGFICQGLMGRNEVINYPVQGISFHFLLWSMNRLVLEELDKNHMKTKVIGQVHDSLVSDVPDEELDDYIALATEVMTKKVREFWPWITIPLEIEVDVTPVGGSWVDKKKLKPGEKISW